ncbi:DgyrCDS6452 [Dimorphilus gyrociliatus]|uniref:DgyrCDS6452 n=1 Tax=Dimorphilus gyrociliatus TaxID=2664684 RepID=A0A7I8VN39_9ANNE|nr:DgyrCDS6452 [Dimorphilus gyrociliatus]
MQNCYRSQSKNTEGMQKDQDDRLTKKHIQTLSFVQEVVNENKALKDKIKELEDELAKCSRLHEVANEAQDRIQKIQADSLKRIDQITADLTEKHANEILRKVQEKLNAEKEWCEKEEKFTSTVESLRVENTKLKGLLETLRDGFEDLEGTKNKLGNVLDELCVVKEENDNLKEECANQRAELSRLAKVEIANKNLADEVRAVNAKRKELEFELSRTRNELSGMCNEDVFASLKAKITKLLREKDEANEREANQEITINDLKSELALTRRAYSDSERQRTELEEEIKKMRLNMEQHRKSIPISGTESFKDYVLLKRDFSALKKLNEELTLKLNLKQTALPKLKPESMAKGNHKGKR